MKKINNIIAASIIIGLSLIITILTIIIKPEEERHPDYNTQTYSTGKYDINVGTTQISHNSLYTSCDGTVSVKSTSQKKYRFIKVKGEFLNSSGSVIDTDSTYAVGDEWLEPGQSSKFHMSVDKDSNIVRCRVTVMEG